MTGELMLGHLCETAKALLTDLNAPSGSCAICLEPLREAEGDKPSVPVQKLPCYHCMHRQGQMPLLNPVLLHLHTRRQTYCVILKAIYANFNLRSGTCSDNRLFN